MIQPLTNSGALPANTGREKPLASIQKDTCGIHGWPVGKTCTKPNKTLPGNKPKLTDQIRPNQTRLVQNTERIIITVKDTVMAKYHHSLTPQELYTTQLATFGAQVLQIVAAVKNQRDDKGQEAFRQAQRLMPHLPRIKGHLYRVVSVAIGGAGPDHRGTNSSQDVLECVLCQTKFRRNQERHLPSCPYSSEEV